MNNPTSKNTASLEAFMVLSGFDLDSAWMWSGCDLDLIWMCYGFDLDLIWIWPGFDLNLIWIWSGFDLDVIWMWSECDLDLIWIWSGFEMEIFWNSPGFELDSMRLSSKFSQEFGMNVTRHSFRICRFLSGFDQDLIRIWIRILMRNGCRSYVILDIFSTIELYSKFADRESYVKAG